MSDNPNSALFDTTPIGTLTIVAPDASISLTHPSRSLDPTVSLSSPMPPKDSEFDNLANTDMVNYLLECTKDVPDLTTLAQSARTSLNLIQPWRHAHPLPIHPAIVVIITEIREVADKFMKNLEMTIQNAGNGFHLATDVITLCESLNVHPAADILAFIDEIRLMAWQASNDALCRSEVFVSIRRELFEIEERIQSESKQVNDLVLLPQDACIGRSQQGGKRNADQNLKMQQYSGAAASEMLRKAGENLDKLIKCLNDFASWCSKMETMLLSLANTVKQGDSRILDSLLVETVQRRWEGVSEKYLQYRINIRNLRDFYPSFHDSLAHSAKGRALNVSLRLCSLLITSASLWRHRQLVSATSKHTSKFLRPFPAEDWDRLKTRITAIVTSILGTAVVSAHGALSLSVNAMPFVPVPGLVPAANLLMAIWGSLRLVESNNSACLRITERCTDILTSVHAEIVKGGEDLENEIDDCLKKLVASFQAVEACFRNYSQRSFHKRYLARDQISREITACYASLNEFLVIFGLSMQIHMYKKQAETTRQLAEMADSLADNKRLLHSLVTDPPLPHA